MQREKKHALPKVVDQRVKDVCSKEVYRDGLGRKAKCDGKKACSFMITNDDKHHSFNARCKELCPNCANEIIQVELERTQKNTHMGIQDSSNATQSQNKTELQINYGGTVPNGEIAAIAIVPSVSLFAFTALIIYFFLRKKCTGKKKTRTRSPASSSYSPVIGQPAVTELRELTFQSTAAAADQDQSANATFVDVRTPTPASDGAHAVPATYPFLPDPDPASGATGHMPVEVHDGGKPPKDTFGDASFPEA